MSAAEEYHAAGWHPFPLPANAKHPPPRGTTGADGVDWTAEQIAAANWSGNVGIRMPDGVLGLDVDAYRGGMDTLHAWSAELGPLPPTWIVHNGRGDGSGIRMFRVPVGSHFGPGAGGIDVIQRGHRYAVAPPSIHPNGRPYRWHDQTRGVDVLHAPVAAELPELPAAWLAHLGADRPARSHTEATPADVEGFTALHAEERAPRFLRHVLDDLEQRLGSGQSRHDAMTHALVWAMEQAAAGDYPASTGLAELAAVWQRLMEADPFRHRRGEWEAMVRHAVGRALADPARIAHIRAEHSGIDVDGPTRLAAERVAPVLDDAWPFLRLDDLNTDAGERDWIVPDIWPRGRALAIWAAAKTGKSELVLWLAINMALGAHPWTMETTRPLRVLYLDYEMVAEDVNERVEEFGLYDDESKRELFEGNLLYALHPPLPPLDTDAGARALEAWLDQYKPDVVIIDTFGRAVRGDENEADTVRNFYRHTGLLLKRRHISYARLDHAGKDSTKGQRGTSAKNDDVDIVWQIRRTSDGVVLDCSAGSRVSWVGPVVKLRRLDAERITYAPAHALVASAAALAFATDMEQRGVDPTMSRRAVREHYLANGWPIPRNETVTEALQIRRKRLGKSGG